MTEKDMWEKMKPAWDAQCHVTRVENIASFGMPDVDCCSQSLEWKIELKINHHGYSVIKPTQVAWIARRYQHNGNVFILAGNPLTLEATLYDAFNILRPGALAPYASQVKICFAKMEPIVTIDMTNRRAWQTMLEEIIKCLQSKYQKI